jgi:hypothetical protein
MSHWVNVIWFQDMANLLNHLPQIITVVFMLAHLQRILNGLHKNSGETTRQRQTHIKCHSDTIKRQKLALKTKSDGSMKLDGLMKLDTLTSQGISTLVIIIMTNQYLKIYAKNIGIIIILALKMKIGQQNRGIWDVNNIIWGLKLYKSVADNVLVTNLQIPFQDMSNIKHVAKQTLQQIIYHVAITRAVVEIAVPGVPIFVKMHVKHFMQHNLREK